MARGVPRSPFDSCSLFITRREEAIEKALQVRLAQIAEERARKRAEARKARDKLAAEVLVLARQVMAPLPRCSSCSLPSSPVNFSYKAIHRGGRVTEYSHARRRAEGISRYAVYMRACQRGMT